MAYPPLEVIIRLLQDEWEVLLIIVDKLAPADSLLFGVFMASAILA